MTNRQTTLYSLCPLYPFDSDSDIINLACGIQIMPATNEFKQFLYNRLFGENGFWADERRIEKAWVAYIPHLDKQLDAQSSEKPNVETVLTAVFSPVTQSALYWFVTTLRLYKEGLVTPGPITLPNIKDEPSFMWMTPPWLDVSDSDYDLEEPQKYTLQKKDIPGINKLWDDVLKWTFIKKNKNLDIAIARFHSAYSGEPEERIIDQMIAFEAICLGESQELSYKLALRTAFLLTKYKKKRKEIFNTMKDAYELRNKIVHGSHKVSREDLQKIIPKSENYLRQSIRKVLSLLSDGHKFEYIRKNLLDTNILDSGTLLNNE